jgi:hypothetical protein
MVGITPQPKSLEDRVLLLEAALADIQEWKANRAARDQWILGTLIGLAGVLALFVVAYVRIP